MSKLSKKKLLYFRHLTVLIIINHLYNRHNILNRCNLKLIFNCVFISRVFEFRNRYGWSDMSESFTFSTSMNGKYKLRCIGIDWQIGQLAD